MANITTPSTIDLKSMFCDKKDAIYLKVLLVLTPAVLLFTIFIITVTCTMMRYKRNVLKATLEERILEADRLRDEEKAILTYIAWLYQNPDKIAGTVTRYPNTSFLRRDPTISRLRRQCKNDILIFYGLKKPPGANPKTSSASDSSSSIEKPRSVSSYEELTVSEKIESRLYNNSKTTVMLPPTAISICGKGISFPFTPYQSQLNFMEKVVDCLNNGWNGALESPTGTGKTLSLLCAGLSWLSEEKLKLRNLFSASGSGLVQTPGPQNQDLIFPAMPRIIYTSRTHSQLSQVIRELNKTEYRNIKVAILGSRDQLCVNTEVMSEPNSALKNRLCRAKVGAGTCSYYRGLEASQDFHLSQVNGKGESQDVPDIEDLLSYGKKRKICPFYYARAAQESADLILMPYNYIVDPAVLRANKINLRGAVIIFDEGHNLPKVCEQSSSMTLSSVDIARCISEAQKALSLYTSELEEYRSVMDKSKQAFGQAETLLEPPGEPFNEKEIAHLIVMLHELEAAVNAIRPEIAKCETPQAQVSSWTGGSKKLPGLVKPGMYMTELLAKVGITEGLKESLCVLTEQAANFLTAKLSKESGVFGNAHKGDALQKFAAMLLSIFSGASSIEQESNMASKVYIHFDNSKNKMGQSTGGDAMPVLFEYMCFSCGPRLLQLAAQGVRKRPGPGIRSMLVTSGTLSPIGGFAQELKVPVHVTLENVHVIETKQLFATIVGKGPDGVELSSSFKNRSNVKYLNSVGNALVNFSKVIPGGILVFFGSYSHMNSCVEHWKKDGAWERLDALKPLFQESREKMANASVIESYVAKCKSDPKGAMLLAVCRGKISEGLDIDETARRAAIVVGIPYPPAVDPGVVLKLEYLQEVGGGSFNTSDWYRVEAARSVNQALGRVIRSKDDFGAMILADSRFASWSSHLFPYWIRESLEHESVSFGSSMGKLSAFFRKHNKAKKGETKSGSSVPENDSVLQMATIAIRKESSKLSSNFGVNLQKRDETKGLVRHLDPKSGTHLSADCYRGYFVEHEKVPRPSGATGSQLFDSLDSLSEHEQLSTGNRPTKSSFAASLKRTHSDGDSAIRTKKRIRVVPNTSGLNSEKVEKVQNEEQSSLRFVQKLKTVIADSKERAVLLTSLKSLTDTGDVEPLVRETKRLLSDHNDLIQELSLFIPEKIRAQFLRAFES